MSSKLKFGAPQPPESVLLGVYGFVIPYVFTIVPCAENVDGYDAWLSTVVAEFRVMDLSGPYEAVMGSTALNVENTPSPWGVDASDQARLSGLGGTYNIFMNCEALNADGDSRIVGAIS